LESEEIEGSGPVGPNNALDHAIVWTPAIQRLAEAVTNWIRLDSPGGKISGKPRTGKSAACVYLKVVLQAMIGYPVEVFIWSMPRNGSTREREYTQERMKQCGCSAIMHRDIVVLRNRLYDHVAQMAEIAAENRVVILIDEAQELAAEHYGYLVHCFNELTRRQLLPFFLLIGQPELESGKYLWDKNEFHQIAGRFHVHNHKFKGIMSDELKEVLAEFDKLIPPAVTGGAASKFFEKNTLANLAVPLSEAIGKLRAHLNLNEEIQLPMQYLKSTILAFIYRTSKMNGDHDFSSVKLMVRCLTDSGFMRVASFYVDPDEKIRE